MSNFYLVLNDFINSVWRSTHFPMRNFDLQNINFSLLRILLIVRLHCTCVSWLNNKIAENKYTVSRPCVWNFPHLVEIMLTRFWTLFSLWSPIWMEQARWTCQTNLTLTCLSLKSKRYFHIISMFSMIIFKFYNIITSTRSSTCTSHYIKCTCIVSPIGDCQVLWVDREDLSYYSQ